MPRTAWTSSRRVPDIASGESMGSGASAVMIGTGEGAVPDVSGSGGGAVVVVCGSGAVVVLSGGGGGGSDMISLESLDTKLVGLGFLPGLRRRL